MLFPVCATNKRYPGLQELPIWWNSFIAALQRHVHGAPLHEWQVAPDGRRMRRKIKGQWQYREMTREEIQEDLESSAW